MFVYILELTDTPAYDSFDTLNYSVLIGVYSSLSLAKEAANIDAESAISEGYKDNQSKWEKRVCRGYGRSKVVQYSKTWYRRCEEGCDAVIYQITARKVVTNLA